MSGPGVPPPPHCLAGGTPPPGSFTLHGRPVDVFADLDGGRHALLYVRARHYDLANGRWLQRDPKGYVDGPNLYEAFGGNPLVNVDPLGTQIWVTERTIQADLNGRRVWKATYTLHRNGSDLGLAVWAFGGTEHTEIIGEEYFPVTPGPTSHIIDSR